MLRNAKVQMALVPAIGMLGGYALPSGKPNIVMIMGDNVGTWNISAYHRGMMDERFRTG